jgi:hypothetical protein
MLTEFNKDECNFFPSSATSYVVITILIYNWTCTLRFAKYTFYLLYSMFCFYYIGHIFNVYYKKSIFKI